MSKAKRESSKALPDRVDIRDWVYQPSLAPLPVAMNNISVVPKVLDQGTEGACTGHALAAVINLLLAQRNIQRTVSPHMLYHLARKFDEWPGENYEGSSARGTMKGWTRFGVCEEGRWKRTHDLTRLNKEIMEEGRATPGGAFYRVSHREIRDVHAAIAETGAVFVTIMVHEGWDNPDAASGIEVPGTKDKIAVIRRVNRANSGHAVALIGYNQHGFIVQNSWGVNWGSGGFALLPYEDYLMHSTDVWVAQLGVPVQADLWATTAGADTRAGLHRASETVPLAEIRPFVVDIGNNGKLSDTGDYWTTEEDLKTLTGKTIREATKKWEKRRILLYLHGGLNDEKSVAKRIIAFRDPLLKNEIYPLHIMWESGFGESIKNIISDLFTDEDERAGSVADWLKKFRTGLTDAKNASLELTMSVPGSALWNEMKENARLASAPGGGIIALAEQVSAALGALSAAERNKYELHIVAHSAGSIFAAHALKFLTSAQIEVKTLQFMAPAISVEHFKNTILSAVRRKKMPMPTMYLLKDAAERADTVGVYGHSLLYLVSNAFEDRKRTPILGMERFVTNHQIDDLADDAAKESAQEMAAFFDTTVNGLPAIVLSGDSIAPGCASNSKSHGGFDNDSATLNSVLYRILGREPVYKFTDRDLNYDAN